MVEREFFSFGAGRACFNGPDGVLPRPIHEGGNVMERKDAVTMKGRPMTLVGPELKVGDKAPEFECIDALSRPVRLSDTMGKVRLIASVPSLDTSVCEVETERLNTEARMLPVDKVAMIVISMDLPFAQERFCGMKDIKVAMTLSDHRSASFGTAYGVLMKEVRLLSRALFVVDGSGVIRHVEYVGEVSRHPDYPAALDVVRGLMGKAAKAA